MYTSTISDQTDHSRTAPALRYDSASPDEYLSDSNSCTDNRSDLGSDDYNVYESNYESYNEEATCVSTSITATPSFQYSLRQEKFNNNFSSKDLLNAIQKISLSPPRDMSDDKGSLDCLPIYSFLFPNEKGSSLYNAYDREEVEDKLVIKIDQDCDRVPKFSVADDISEVYGLPGIHECINGQKLLRAVIDIDATQEDMEANGVKPDSVFIRICCSFISALYRILDCSWEDILKGLVIATSSDSRLPGQNFNLRLIGSVKKGRVKRILLSSITNRWNKLDYTRVQPPISLCLEVRPRMLSIEKNNNPLRISVGSDILQKYAELVLQKHSSYLRDWNIEEKDSENFETGKIYILENLSIPDDVNLLVLSTHHSYSNAVCYYKTQPQIILRYQWQYKSIRPQEGDNDLTDLNIEWIKALRKDKQFSIIHNTFQPQKGKTFHLAPNKETVLAELWDWAREISSLPSDKRTTDFPELRIKKYHGKSDPVEKAHDFSNVEESWSDVDLVAYTSTLKIGVSCTNPKFERAFCLFNSYIETNAGTNQMLFRMRCIRDYVCCIKQRSSNVPITEEGLFRWLLNAKRECLPKELQNRGIFPDIDSIIRNKDVPTIRLWVTYMLEKF
ncbi:hypothetical protein C1646_773621 [Rhizophagus diaphanus]|nr:hypothetical protein C1646_773621 [Rhizophagus diaphanus] [Rhizophagus sp. MUCL 43196]